jgi:hypothetical protein
MPTIVAFDYLGTFELLLPEPKKLIRFLDILQKSLGRHGGTTLVIATNGEVSEKQLQECRRYPQIEAIFSFHKGAANFTTLRKETLESFRIRHQNAPIVLIDDSAASAPEKHRRLSAFISPQLRTQHRPAGTQTPDSCCIPFPKQLILKTFSLIKKLSDLTLASCLLARTTQILMNRRKSFGLSIVFKHHPRQLESLCLTIVKEAIRLISTAPFVL